MVIGFLFRTSSGVVGDKKNVFVLLFVKKEPKDFLAFEIFVSLLNLSIGFKICSEVIFFIKTI